MAVQGVASERQRTAVTVIMPVRNEAKHIEQAVRAVLANSGAGQRFDLQVLVVDGMSDDGTREIVTRLAAEFPQVTLLDNPQATVPFALNAGLRRACGEIIIRVDGHAFVAPDFIANALSELERRPECDCVGGSIDNIDENDTARAVSLAMSSPFGVGNATFRTGGEGYVDTLAFGAYRREVFDRIGEFDETLTRNQDDEFNYRLTKAGGRIWLSPRIRSRYVVRSSFPKLFRQYRQYGYWKVYVNRKHGAVTNLRQLVPAAFVATVVLLALLALAVPAARLVLAAVLLLYLTGALVAGAAKVGSGISLLPRVMLAFATMHVGYGLGYLEGLYRFMLLGERPGVRNVELSR